GWTFRFEGLDVGAQLIGYTTSVLVPAEVVLAVPGPVGTAQSRDGHFCMERGEPPRAAGEPDLSGTGSEIERDLAERVVAGPYDQDDVAVQRRGAGRLEIDDPRADLDRVEVGGGDRAEGIGEARVLRAFLRHVESSVPLRRPGGAGGRDDSGD